MTEPAKELQPLVPQPRGGALLLHDKVALKAQLDSYAETRRMFIEWVFANLTAGVDYMLIHRKVGPRGNKIDCPNDADHKSRSCPKCKGKATLCKPGAEKICGLLRLTPKFHRDAETCEMLGNVVGVVALVCELRNQDDTVVAEGRGARNQTADYGDVNKTIKMVQKSAQTDAVLRCAGLSEVFTQDLEDIPDKPEAKVAKPVEPEVVSATISDQQVADIDTILRDVGETEPRLMKWLTYGKKLEEIRAEDYAKVMAKLEEKRGDA